eukprot:CAMPEP_0117454252 /NCGR_PEP_ID=MMETSP0759-20121206/10701_1 /TAXON_ID=63605 /ORGANISM="Percolomonas cosmopolitus, Strain WS" /LENGTH=746 /DNA_ID=CAMNT_0005247425 /DNA_START=250 /DNA_END=2490 /DNA_ORIENTATION=+
MRDSQGRHEENTGRGDGAGMANAAGKGAVSQQQVRPLVENVPGLQRLDTQSAIAVENNLSDADYEITKVDFSRDSTIPFYLSNWELYEKERELPNINEVHLSRHIWRRGLYGIHLENTDERCIIPIGLWDDGDLLKKFRHSHCEKNYNDDGVQIPHESFHSIAYFHDDTTPADTLTRRNSFTYMQEKSDENPLLWVHPQCRPLAAQQLTEKQIEEYNQELRRLCQDVIPQNVDSKKENPEIVVSRPPTLSFNRTLVDSINGPHQNIFSTEGLTFQQRTSKCPIVYLFRGEFSQTPHFDGFYVNHMPIRIDDTEQYIFVACGGSQIWKVNITTGVDEKSTKQMEIIAPKYANGLVRPSHSLPEMQRQKDEIPPAPMSVHADPPNMSQLPPLVATTPDQEKEESDEKKKPNICIILMEGLSRVHFHRRMLNTIDFLQHSLQDYGYRAFEFFKYLTTDMTSNSNLTPIFSGESWWKHCIRKDKECLTSSSVPHKKFVWTQLAKKNYKTCAASELSWTTSRADWRNDVRDWTNYFTFPLDDLERTFTNHQPICMSGRKSYDHVFDYAAQFFQRHKSNPKFILTQFLQAQEPSMNVIADMDRALAKYLNEIVAQKEENTYIMLLSDEGSPQERSPFFEERTTGKLEQKMPLLILLTPPGMESNHLENLYHNQHHLITGMDVYETMLQLGGLKGSGKRSDILHDAPKSIVHAQMNSNRDCASMNIPQHMCICNLDATPQNSIFICTTYCANN